jgi:hypothetical protein
MGSGQAQASANRRISADNATYRTFKFDVGPPLDPVEKRGSVIGGSEEQSQG